MDEITELPDEELVVRSIENTRYFTPLVERYQDKLFRYIKRLSNLEQEDREDVLQNVFTKAYTNLNSFDTSLAFSSWIYRITHNEVISFHRKRVARPYSNFGTLDESIINNISADIDLPRELESKEASEQIKKSIYNLQEKYKDIIILQYLENKDYKEISDILKIPTGTVATRINRAKLQIKKELSKKDFD